jgi:hypothetical protein
MKFFPQVFVTLFVLGSAAEPRPTDKFQLTALIKTRLRRMQYRPGLLDGFLARPGST